MTLSREHNEQRADHHRAIITGCADAIIKVPLAHFALLLVTREHVEVSAVPYENLNDVLDGCLDEELVASVAKKRDDAVNVPGFREHLIVVLELDDVRAAWEPPNVRAVGASVACFTVPGRPVGVS